MLANARQKFPAYADRLVHHDCRKSLPRSTQADVLVSMFGAPNYLGTETLNQTLRRSWLQGRVFCVLQ
jgi:hypothetical protein